MEFSNRNAQQPPSPARVAPTTSAAGTTANQRGKNPHWKGSPTWLRAVWMILLFSATILVVALLTLMYFGGSKESDYVDKDKKQAVFLTNGQVYFGDLAAVNGEFLDLRDIYYLNVNQQVQPKDDKAANDQQNSISLVKLGCELHGPVDQMVINRDQVTFWENLKTDGQVSKAIEQWVQQNPDGQKCQAGTQATGDTQP
jgi:hypothetical protein